MFRKRYFCDFSFWVAGGGSVAEFQCGFVDFVELQEFGTFFGHFAGEENEEAGGEGVEGASVADFDFVTEFIAEAGTDFGNYAKAADAGGLVDKNDLVFGHGSIIAYLLL